MENKTPEKRLSLLLKSFLLVGFFWTVFVASMLIWAIQSGNENTNARTLAEARAFFKQIVLTRYWNAAHGGVHVRVTEETQPNPYLDVPYRDAITTDGQMLTLISAADMTRQMAEIVSSMGDIQYHITSLKPIRPENAPRDWEAKALRSFSAKSDEFFEWWVPGDREEKAFRYMGPLWTEKSCLACHSKQGYAEGDLTGGISVTIPARDILSERDHYSRELILRYFAIWAIGLLGLFLSFRLSRGEYVERSRLIEKLETTLKDVKTLKGLIPICASCKKVRNDEGYWDQIEVYLRDRSDAEFSHGICPDCMKKLYPEFAKDRHATDSPRTQHVHGQDRTLEDDAGSVREEERKAMSELPRVLLLGDSIRVSYQPLVARLLEGRAEVVGPADNCQYSLYTLSSLDRWIGEFGRPDVVHWNNGIHDAGHNPARSPVQIPIEFYRANLAFILDRLTDLTPKVIWASSTPVHPDRPFRDSEWSWRNEEIDQYNRIARELMESRGVPINDLHALVWADASGMLSEDQLHLSVAGQERCAQAVADCVSAFLQAQD
ncbi:MAG: DUF3365 domain-containing protein [Candidatus Latescibacterota bacterium]